MLYKGTKIIGAAFVQLLEESAILRSLIIGPQYQHSGFGGHLLHQLEKWIQLKNKPIVYLHSAQNALGFYLHRGYQEMIFNDVSIDVNSVRLGKDISHIS